MGGDWRALRGGGMEGKGGVGLQRNEVQGVALKKF